MEICWVFKPQTSIFSTKLNFFFLAFKFQFFFVRQLKVTILDYCISLNSVQKNLVVLGVVDMCHLLLIMKISKSIGSFTISSTNSSTVTSPSMLCTEEDLLLMSFLASVGFFASIWGNLLRWGFSTLPKLSKLEILYWMMWTFWVLSGLEYSPAIKSATELDALVSQQFVGLN